MKLRHQHIIQWGILNAGKKNSRKVLRCGICKKSLDEILSRLIIQVFEDNEKLARISLKVGRKQK